MRRSVRPSEPRRAEQQCRIGSERPRDGHPLGLASRQLARPRARAATDAERREQPHRDVQRLLTPSAQHMREGQGNVLERRKMVEQRVPLEHEPHAAAQRFEPGLRRHGSGLEREAVDQDVTTLEALQRRHRPERRRLADARQSHQRDHFSPPHFQLEPREDLAPVVGETKV